MVCQARLGVLIVSTKMAQTIKEFWRTYQKSEEGVDGEPYLTDEYGDSPELADELTGLILEGKKTATCCTLYEYEHENEKLPEIGERNIVLNGSNQPVCITEVNEVAIVPFIKVGAQFAYEEGEGDCSLESWRREHWKYFSRVLPSIGFEPNEEMKLVCVRFEVIYQPSANK